MDEEKDNLLIRLELVLDRDLLASEKSGEPTGSEADETEANMQAIEHARSSLDSFAQHVASMEAKLEGTQLKDQTGHQCPLEELIVYTSQVFLLDPDQLVEQLEAKKLIEKGTGDLKILRPNLFSWQSRSHLEADKTSSDLLSYIRLYFHCVLYQLRQLPKLSSQQKIVANNQPERRSLNHQMLLSNLVYLPGLQLIRSHGKLLNLTPLDDQVCKRITLMMAIKEFKKPDRRQAEPEGDLGMKEILISMLLNEYHELDRQRQPAILSPKQQSVPSTSPELNKLANFELAALAELSQLAIWPEVEALLVPSANQDDSLTGRRNIFLSSIKTLALASSALSRMTQAGGSPSRMNQLIDVLDRRFCETILNYIKQQMVELVSKGSTKSTAGWSTILQIVSLIDQELSLNWLPGGLDGLLSRQSKLVKEIDLLSFIDKDSKLQSTIKSRLDRFLNTNQI